MVATVLNLVCGLVLAGLSVYYFTVQSYVSGGVFLAVGLFCVASSVYKFFKSRRHKPSGENKKDGEDGRGGGSLDFKI